MSQETRKRIVFQRRIKGQTTDRPCERSARITKEFRVQAWDDGKRHRARPDTMQGITEVIEARWWLSLPQVWRLQALVFASTAGKVRRAPRRLDLQEM